nr:phage portal protein [Mammaliicoccus sciuri]
MLEEINPNNDKDTRERLKSIVDRHILEIPNIVVGEDYYNHKSKILTQKTREDAEGNTSVTKPDWRIVTNYHQNLVDQKVSYIAGNPITIKCDDDKALHAIHDLFNVKFDDKLIDILTDASNKGISWIQPYINEQGELNIYKVPAEQAIPIWKNNECEELTAFIRVFKVGKETKVEYWDSENVSYYVLHDETLIPDYFYGDDYVFTHYEGGSWGRVPFIAFKNNTQELSDLAMYKTIIDAIDKRLSDTQNTFDEATELIYILKGYEGESLDQFMTNLKYKKAINVSGDGGVDTIQVEVPIIATKEYITMMRDYLVEFGQGIDFQNDKFGNSPSGIALKFLYSNLDLKANKLTRKTYVALQELLQYVIDFNNLNVDVKDIEIQFNFNRMINELEQTQIATSSTALLSKETIIGHHPWVDDAQGELERVDNESLALNTTLPSMELDDEYTTQ